tara:strand:+ start:286 stop:576 length:291 start_codon:yes stop_codon:yes gene_type:complete
MSDYCPLIQKKCKEHKCKFYIQVIGRNPQTGQDVSDWNCAVSWLPMLLIEGSQQTRQAGAAIESFRNEVVKTQSLIDISGAQVEQIENQQTKMEAE